MLGAEFSGDKRVRDDKPLGADALGSEGLWLRFIRVS